MVKWKCIHTKTTSAKKCIDLGHRDCLKEMCEHYDILEIEKIKINLIKIVSQIGIIIAILIYYLTCVKLLIIIP